VPAGIYPFLGSHNKLSPMNELTCFPEGAMSETMHLDRKFLLAFSRGDLPLEIIAKMSLEHLSELCPRCRQELQVVQDQLTLSPPVPMVQAVLKSTLGELKRQHRHAEKDFQELLALSQAERLDRIRQARRRFKGSHLVYLLLNQTEQEFTRNLEEAKNLAHVAHMVVHHSPAESAAVEVEALVYAFLGNAYRAAGDRRQADSFFINARRFVRHNAVREPALLARIDELEGSLRKDQRRFTEAEEMFSRALVLYGMSGGRPGEVGRVLVNLGGLYFVQGKNVAAIEMTRFALQLLSPNSHTRLYTMARYNLALQLTEIGQHEEAAGILESDAALFTQMQEPWTQLRLLGIHGKIAVARGELLAARHLFEEARTGFIAQGIGFDAAIVSMELALLHLRTGELPAVKVLAEEMVQLFQAQDVHRETTAALLLFEKAVQQEALTADLVEDLASYLKRARENPELRFTRRRRWQAAVTLDVLNG
jgi:tetratricopeptide (TPR) repeat protein